MSWRHLVQDILELMANADEGVYAVDKEQRIILWNKRAEDILGYTPQEAIGRRCYDLLTGRDNDGNVVCGKSCMVMLEARASGRAPSHYFLMSNKAGESVWLHITHVVVPSAKKELETVIHIFRDVSDFMEARDLVRRLRSYLTKSETTLAEPQTLGAGVIDQPADSLTNREREVLSLLTQGANAKSVAEQLAISRATARNHVRNILDKLGVHSALEAVAYAHKNALL
ncbi:MAG: PAS domain-containing protein [Chloroflexi bacterium]|nr:PAS domain-containing protein [Chloroflexota bacterium]